MRALGVGAVDMPRLVWVSLCGGALASSGRAKVEKTVSRRVLVQR